MLVKQYWEGGQPGNPSYNPVYQPTNPPDTPLASVTPSVYFKSGGQTKSARNSQKRYLFVELLKV